MCPTRVKQVTYDEFMMNKDSLKPIPTTKPSGCVMSDAAYATEKAKHKTALTTANFQRGGARGVFVHYEYGMEPYATTNGLTSNRSGIDLEKPGSDLRYEVMVAGRWDTHNGESFQSNPWRSLTYTPLSEEDRNVG